METNFKLGQRVELHPATDLWMRGCRFGTVVKIGRKWVSVKLDLQVRPRRIHPDNLNAIADHKHDYVLRWANSGGERTLSHYECSTCFHKTTIAQPR